MRSKRGALLDKEIIEIILAAAGIFLLLIIMYNLISPNFDRKDKTSEAYFNDFMEKVSSIKDGGEVEFSFWQPSNKNEEYYLVYFGEKASVEAGAMRFFSLGANFNHTCVCHLQKKSEYLCSYCANLDFPIRISEAGVDVPIIFREGDILKLKKEEGFYSYEIVKK